METGEDYKPCQSSKAAIGDEKKNVSTSLVGTASVCVVKREETFNSSDTMLDEKTKVSNDVGDVEVDITTCTNITKTGLAETEDPEATEYSSSFVDKTSNTERYSGLSDAEVESQFFSDNDLASHYDAFGSLFKTRKKLTNHWRDFIRPLMWRCKWTELKIKEIESQSLKYAREMAANERSKHSALRESISEDLFSKSMPFSNQHYRTRAIKRRKRKRVEDTTDVSSYMSNHNLFSYLENKRSNPDVSSLIVDFGNKATTDQHTECSDKCGFDDSGFIFEFGDGSGSSLEAVLWKIETVHSRVHKLKNQLDMIMTKNVAKFSSSENLSLLAAFDAQTSSAPSPTFSAGNGEAVSMGAAHVTPQHISAYDIEDLVLTESAISSFGEAVHVPDIIESTVGLLSAADVTFHHSRIGDSCEDIMDNVLIHNEVADGEVQAFVGASKQLIETHLEADKGEEGESTDPCPIPNSYPDSVATPIVTQEQSQSSLKSCLASEIQFPRYKRKRGERKGGSGGWSKKCTGDPDSQ
ncbi:hypothetical protein K2173_017191 [Erythroxylum novogranatense]|uniref:Uncharacterized protein n=1 Tax=Erythroxylum novogranatense TaxID=1862640 RepID=A0AAV8U630_9ROSI|nr:hypothetical protein K2173_017191 [Erythroxylum novogranatense]